MVFASFSNPKTSIKSKITEETLYNFHSIQLIEGFQDQTVGVLGQMLVGLGRIRAVLLQIPAVLEQLLEDLVLTVGDFEVVRVDRVVSAKML